MKIHFNKLKLVLYVQYHIKHNLLDLDQVVEIFENVPLFNK